MKLLTKEEEAEHYTATLKGGIGGGVAGIAVGATLVYGAALRYPAFRHLTLPLKAFLVTSSGTFAAIISADKYSRAFEAARHPEEGYKDEAERQRVQRQADKPTLQRMKDWGRENRYPIVGASWVASMAIALGIVGRSPYLTTAQKLVQARVYAQGLTVAVLIATAAFEIGDKSEEKGRWETIKIIDPKDPNHKHLIEKRIHHESYAGEDQWRDMVAAEEQKIEARKEAVQEEERKAKAKYSQPQADTKQEDKSSQDKSGNGDEESKKGDHGHGGESKEKEEKDGGSSNKAHKSKNSKKGE